jgi:Pectate lyase superfamily protein
MKQILRRIGRDSSSSLLLRCFRRFIPLLFLCIATTSSAAVIDVRTYGAIPNDSGDDSSAIQRAIHAAPDGSTIYFPKGTYLVSNVTIDHRSGLTLSGDGSTLTILRHHGPYLPIFISTGSTDMLITKLGFDTNGVPSFGGFNFYSAKRITITRTHFFDSNKQPVGENDRYSWVFGRGSIPSEDILIRDNLIEDLQLEVDFSVRVRIEGNTIVRPVTTAGIGVFALDDNTSARDYTIQRNTIVDPVVAAGGIVVHLDPPSSSYSTMKTFRILDNRIVYTKYISRNHVSAIRIGTGDNSKATAGNVFDDIVIENNVIYKDPGSPYDFDHPIVFGNSSATANFKFDNTNVSNNLIHYNNKRGIPNIEIRQKGINYIESNNLARAISADSMPPSVPTALTTTHISDNQIHLAWNASVDNIGVYRYRIYRNGVENSYSTTTSYLDKNLKPGVSYIYTATAIDLNGNESSQSYSVTATVPSGTAIPVAPSNLTFK